MHGRKLMQVTMAVALVMLLAVPAAAGGAGVTSGDLATLQGGADLGFEITGRVVMRRVPGDAGKTLVVVQVRGLDPNTVYPVHVHNAPCSATPPGGGHYQDQIGGPVDPVNEIWPTVETNAAGNGLGVAVHGHRARPDAMAVVIHYPPATSIRLACADLT